MNFNFTFFINRNSENCRYDISTNASIRACEREREKERERERERKRENKFRLHGICKFDPRQNLFTVVCILKLFDIASSSSNWFVGIALNKQLNILNFVFL